ncbi:MAG: ABC transporter substrate-binding protein [Lachnospiraceae bacterium]|nr:ABC transporter substrate-binding protein [Lachnospiraceae bacterium]MDD3615235.1 ABC transporter substrate-binding protein [Lachnospiraceae bacterium]
MKKLGLFIGCVLGLCVVVMGCGNRDAGEADLDVVEESGLESSEDIVIGFSQIGAESDWRSSNTESMRETFSAGNGYRLLLEDGQQKQANQIMAIRTFIQQDVDYIVLAPVVETGWETVLQEARDAQIPVILVDRMIDVSDDSLYTAWVGSDFLLEGRRVGEWLNQFLTAKGIENANVVNIQGTIGATAQIGRTRGLERACTSHGNMTLLAEVSADFTQAKAREVMDSLLREYEDINVVYCENDNEAFGVIEAIENSGRAVGSDIAAGEIMVVSFDGVNEKALQYVMEDKISCVAECNPLHGPRVQAVIEDLEAGESVERFSYVDESVYVHDDTVQSVVVDDIEYPMKVVSKDLLDESE